MNYALLAVKLPTDKSTNNATAWGNFLETLETKINTCETVEMLTPTLLQCSLESSLHEFLEVQHLCKQAGFSTITSFFENKPTWLTS